MEPKEIATLIDYNYWANHRVLEAATKLSHAQFVAPDRLIFQSVRGSLVHVLAAELVWRSRCQDGVSPSGLMMQSEFPTLASLRVRWETEEASFRRYLPTLTAAKLNENLEYKTTTESPQDTPLWQILLHVVNHGTQFRSEAAVALSERGYSPGDLDFIAYVRERK